MLRKFETGLCRTENDNIGDTGVFHAETRRDQERHEQRPGLH